MYSQSDWKNYHIVHSNSFICSFLQLAFIAQLLHTKNCTKFLGLNGPEEISIFNVTCGTTRLSETHT